MKQVQRNRSSKSSLMVLKDSRFMALVMIRCWFSLEDKDQVTKFKVQRRFHVNCGRQLGSGDMG